MKFIRQLKSMIATGELAVFASGLVGLGLQILAGRLLAPSFGSSVYTWGSIIGVFMITLSLGYHVGGKRAAKATKQDALNILLFSALFVAFLAAFGQGLASFFGSLPLPSQYAALPAVLILFGPPSFLFGLLTPYAVTLSAKRHKGEASGRIFTLDTVGSIFGSFGATFLLIPLFGLQTSFVILGCIAVLAALLIWPKRNTIIFSAIILLLLFLPLFSQEAETEYLHIIRESPYQRLEVIDTGSIRTLYNDGGPQSAFDMEDPLGHVYQYPRYAHIPLLMDDTIQDVLFIGGGGFTVPKQFAAKGLNVTVVELDPVVVELARAYFQVDQYDIEIIVGDGREYLQDNSYKYDLIVVDAYKKDRVPFHLATQEFHELVYEDLDENGIVFMNLIATPTGEGSKWFRSELKTVGSVFPTTYAYSIHRDNRLQNIEIMGTKTQKLSYALLAARNTLKNAGLEDALRNEMLDVPTDDVAILYDDRAPVDTLLTSISDLPLDLISE